MSSASTMSSVSAMSSVNTVVVKEEQKKKEISKSDLLALFGQVNELLFQKWDPLNLKHYEQINEYSSYVSRLLNPKDQRCFIIGETDEKKILQKINNSWRGKIEFPPHPQLQHDMKRVISSYHPEQFRNVTKQDLEACRKTLSPQSDDE